MCYQACESVESNVVDFNFFFLFERRNLVLMAIIQSLLKKKWPSVGQLFDSRWALLYFMCRTFAH